MRHPLLIHIFLFTGMIVVALSTVCRFGIESWVVIPPGYAARVASFAWIGAFSLLELPRFRNTTLLMSAFSIAFVELTYTLFSNVGCYQFFIPNVIASGGWFVWFSHVIVWVEAAAIILIALRPRFTFGRAFIVWAAWMAVWTVLGAPVMNGFCGGYTTIPSNYLYEIVNGLTTYGMLYFTIRPRDEQERIAEVWPGGIRPSVG